MKEIILRRSETLKKRFSLFYGFCGGRREEGELRWEERDDDKLSKDKCKYLSSTSLLLKLKHFSSVEFQQDDVDKEFEEWFLEKGTGKGLHFAADAIISKRN